MLKSDKRGSDFEWGEIIFILMNILFASLMIVYIWNSSNAAFVYEERYAKQISLLIDSSKPGMDFEIDATPLIEIAEKKGVPPGEIIFIEPNEGIVKVKLNQNGGFEYKYFQDYSVSYEVKGNKLYLSVR